MKVVIFSLLFLLNLNAQTDSSEWKPKPFRIFCHGPIICAMAKEILGKELIDQNTIQFKELSLRKPIPANVLSYDVLLFMGQKYIEDHYLEISDIFSKKNEDVFYVGQNPLYSAAYPRPEVQSDMDKYLLSIGSLKNYDFDSFFFFPLVINRTYDQLLGFLGKRFDIAKFMPHVTFPNKEKVYDLEAKMSKVCNQRRVVFSFSQYGLSNFFVQLGMTVVIEGDAFETKSKFLKKVYVRSPYVWNKNLTYPKDSFIWDLSNIPLYPMVKPGDYLETLFSQGLAICQNL